MKRLLQLGLVAGMALSLAACGSNEDVASDTTAQTTTDTSSTDNSSNSKDTSKDNSNDSSNNTTSNDSTTNDVQMADSQDQWSSWSTEEQDSVIYTADEDFDQQVQVTQPTEDDAQQAENYDEYNFVEKDDNEFDTYDDALAYAAAHAQEKYQQYGKDIFYSTNREESDGKIQIFWYTK